MPVFRSALLLVLAACALAPARAQESAIPVIPVVPPKESPFFVLNDEPLNPAAAAAKAAGPRNDFPRNKTAEVNAGRMFTSFFTEMFASVRLGQKPTSGSRLVVTPEKFSLDDRRELTVTFTVENRTSKLVKLDFPNAQRIEILVRDPSGKVIEKWSDDRAFAEVSGVVMINPDENIQYEEKISTRDMQPGLTYSIEASLANNPEFTKATEITPSDKPRALQPNPALPAPAAAPAPTPSQG